VESLRVEYNLPDETGRPVSMLVTHTQDGATDAEAEYRDAYAYIDGLGRTVVTLSEADPVEDGFAWIAEGLTDYDAKGAPRRKYLAWSYDGAPEQYNLARRRRRAGGAEDDAFGRAGNAGLMGRFAERHRAEADAWDRRTRPGAASGSMRASEDAHGAVRMTERGRPEG
jgi:hypothetical protein